MDNNTKIPLPAFFKNTRLAWVAVLVSLMALLGAVMAFLVHWTVGIIWVVLVVLALVVVFKTLQLIGQDTADYLENLSYRVNRGEQEALIQMPIGVLLYSAKEEVEWVNPYLQAQIGEDILVGRKLETVSADMAKQVANAAKGKVTTSQLTWQAHDYRMAVQPELRAIYFQDVTESNEVQVRYEAHRLFIGLVSLDNYDEVTEGLSDSDASSLRTYVTRELSEWMNAHNIYVRRLTTERYMLLGYRDGLRLAENDKFNILNTIREATSIQNSPITLSIGIAYDETNIEHLADNAQTNLDLALGRGGDQVVVKSQSGDARFYGGNTNPMAKRTRVRARMISQALVELINQADQVYIMGHFRPDMDSFGAALGVRRLAEMNDTPAFVVHDVNGRAHSDIKLLLQELGDEPADKNALMSSSDALKNATDATLLILVDHSKPSISESREVFEKLQDRVVIIDHHRRGEEFPNEAQLVYIESYASSTSELVTELFEYQPRRNRGLTRIEATAMLAGIQIDTKSFTLRSGTRTFDAASYLRSVGADGSLIQDFMKESVDEYKQRAHLVERMSLIGNAAIVVGEDDVTYDSVVAAQAADSLLQMVGVEMSFVITRRDATTITVSARSTGKQSVQLIMEKLGGGGHLSMAAAQISDVTTLEVYEQLLAAMAPDEESEN
jgi:c-di-AMP phosphodiesterase-like protein